MKSFLDGLPQLEVIKDLEKDIDFPPEFFVGLIEEDDWSFVIKIHSLIEAAINHLSVEAGLHIKSAPIHSSNGFCSFVS